MFLLCANLGLPVLWGSEGRWAVIARGMLRSGDLLNTALGISDYWDKPLLSYWQVLPLSYISGGVNEFTVRFPSVIWAVVLLLLTYKLAKIWFDEQTAVAAIGSLATTYFFVFWGRNAQVEMTNATMVLLCLWYFLKHRFDCRHTWVYGLGVLMAIGANMKGLGVYGVPIFCIVTLSLVKREWSWVPPLGIALTAGLLSTLLFLAVPAAASIHFATWEPLRSVWRENVLRFFGMYDHKDPVYTYCLKLFYIAAPWSLLLPAALIHSLQKTPRRLSQLPEAVILFGAIFIFFTVSGSRRPYYLLPILPFVAILVANMVKEFGHGMLGRGIEWAVKGSWVFLGLATLALSGIAVVFLDGLWYVSALLGGIGVVLLASTLKKYVWGMVGSIFGIWLIYVLGVIPLTAQVANIKTQVAEVNALGKGCGFFKVDDARIIYYLDKPYRVFYDEASALAWATQTGGVLITRGDFSDPHWQCVVKGRRWKAMIPRKVTP